MAESVNEYEQDGTRVVRAKNETVSLHDVIVTHFPLACLTTMEKKQENDDATNTGGDAILSS